MAAVMDMAKVTSKGQITIPVGVRKAVGLREGDKVLFVQLDDGTIALRSSNLDALAAGRAAFTGAAEEAGLADMDDMVDLVRSVRAERAAG